MGMVETGLHVLGNVFLPLTGARVCWCGNGRDKTSWEW